MHSFMVSSGICPKGADFLGPLMLKKEDLVSGGARLNAENKNVYVGVSSGFGGGYHFETQKTVFNGSPLSSVIFKERLCV